MAETPGSQSVRAAGRTPSEAGKPSDAGKPIAPTGSSNGDAAAVDRSRESQRMEDDERPQDRPAPQDHEAPDDAERPTGRPRSSDRDLWELDDRRDRDELRSRYYGLLQELRVVLPGVQVLLAFLFAVPFAEGFTRLDSFERGAFGVAILSALLAVICMLTPAAMHRFGERTARRARLTWSIRLTMAGLAFLALALMAALWTVARFVYGLGTALFVTVPVSLSIPVLWWLLPRGMGRRANGEEEPEGPPDRHD